MVDGSVRIGGEKARLGYVRFVALQPESTGVVKSVDVAILQGRYRVSTGGGLFPGRYRVEVAVQQPTGRRTPTNTGMETIEADELETISDPTYEGEASPLVFSTDGRTTTRFDIEVPRRIR
jgi:hypothetical protein